MKLLSTLVFLLLPTLSSAGTDDGSNGVATMERRFFSPGTEDGSNGARLLLARTDDGSNSFGLILTGNEDGSNGIVQFLAYDDKSDAVTFMIFGTNTSPFEVITIPVQDLEKVAPNLLDELEFQHLSTQGIDL